MSDPVPEAEGTLGELGFTAYRAHHTKTSMSGHRIYEWAELHENQRACWEVAASAIAERVSKAIASKQPAMVQMEAPPQ